MRRSADNNPRAAVNLAMLRCLAAEYGAANRRCTRGKDAATLAQPDVPYGCVRNYFCVYA